MKPARILAGRREGELLALPSVQRMTDILARRCREESWVRTSVASLERFRQLTGNNDLEHLKAQALVNPALAEQALYNFATALKGYTESQVSALAMGPKLWFRLNGINVPWRPLPGLPTPGLNTTHQPDTEHVILQALIGSGLHLAELLRLRIGDVGSLDQEGRLIPDIAADPLAVQHIPRIGKQGERITFLTYQARQAILASLAPNSEAGHTLDLTSPLINKPHGTQSLRASIVHARQRNKALIRAGSDVNVALCRATGDFFRDWGLPGSRFEGEDILNIEEFI